MDEMALPLLYGKGALRAEDGEEVVSELLWAQPASGGK